MLRTAPPPIKANSPELQEEIRRLWDWRARVLQPPQAAERPWYRIQNAVDDAAEIYIYDAIGWLGVSAADFVGELRKLTAFKLTLHLNSPGGSAWDGIAIYNALRDHDAEVTVVVDAMAASAASVIAMAGDHVVMNRSSQLMIHDPWALVIGNQADMRKEAEVLNKLGDAIAAVYADKAGGERSEWRALMSEETWYTAQEAVDAGLADEVASATASVAAVAPHAFDLSVFRHPPVAALAPESTATTSPHPGSAMDYTATLAELQSMLAAAKDE